MKKVFMFVFAMCLALFAVGAMAQTATTGAIEGTVTDPQGNAVPNATVTVTGSNLISAQTATTDDQGRFRIGNLPPGRYDVTVGAVAGFAETKRDSQVEVNLDRTSTGNVQVTIAGQTATVNVTSTAGAGVDVTSNTSGSNVTSEQFSNFPTQRTVQGLYSIAPTVAPSGLKDASGRDRDPSVGGASGPENNYILDGVNTTDPAFGGSGANLPFEFIQEVEIKTGSYGAEYAARPAVSSTSSPRAEATRFAVTRLLISPPKEWCVGSSICRSLALRRKASRKSTPDSTSAVRLRKTSCGSLARSIRIVVRTIT